MFSEPPHPYQAPPIVGQGHAHKSSGILEHVDSCLKLNQSKLTLPLNPLLILKV